MREKVGKSRNTVFFQWFGAPEGRKVGSLKRRVRSQLARWEMKNCTPLWREAHLQVKMYKTLGVWTTFGSWDVEKVHAVVARSTFPSQNVQNTPWSDHFWTSWDVEKVHAVVARSTFPSQNVQNTPCADHFWQLRCRKSARRCGAKHISKSKCTKHHHVRTTFGGSDVVSRGRRKGLCTLSKVTKTWGFCNIFNYTHYTTLHSHYTPLHYYTTLHYLPLHCIAQRYTTLHYTTLHYITLHYTTLPSTTLHYTTLHYTPQHYNYNYTTTLHYTPLH